MFRRFFFTGQISSLSSNKLGRESVIVVANGSAKDIKYAMSMTFGKMSEPLTKVQTVDSTSVAQSYDLAYKYEDALHPTAPSQIGHEHYTYDANGNPILVENDSTSTTREMFWDEDNRLMVLSDNGKTSRYTYNAGGERIIKSHGSMEGVYINGAPQGITFHETDEFTLYPASIITVNRHRFTKHYFIGDKRVASRIGLGEFNNVYGSNGSNVTAGQRDYAERMNQIENQREDYYKAAGVAPGLPTMKGSYADPEVTGVGYNVLIKELGDHSVPENWVQRPVVNTEAGSTPGAPLAWGASENPDDAVAGYGYVPCDTSEVEETFYYHSDHLGSTSYITDKDANVTQYDAYLPYGELLVDEHSSSADLPYKFNGKELDEETGLYYYGARYMNPVTSMWYGVDPLAEKYPNISAFVYCHNNPVMLIDPDGMTDYKIDKNGYLSLSQNTDDKTDRIIATNGKTIVIDKNITMQLLNARVGYIDSGTDKRGHYAEGGKSLLNLFYFVANNTDVEWVFNGYQTQKGIKYLLATTHSKESVLFTNGSNDEYNLKFSVHTHPGDDLKNNPPYASGFNTTEIIKDELMVKPSCKFQDNPYGDRGTVWNTYGRIQARDIKNKKVRSKYPPFYIYHIKSQNRIKYDPFNRSIVKKRIRKPSDLIW